MSEALKLPYFTIDAEKLAKWLDGQPDSWWFVDGDPVLTSRVDFPCPSDELATALRQQGQSLKIFDPRAQPKADGEAAPIDELNKLADTANNSGAKTYLLSWEADDNQWLLVEDPNAAKDSA